jgi:hypothetical protein
LLSGETVVTPVDANPHEEIPVDANPHEEIPVDANPHEEIPVDANPHEETRSTSPDRVFNSQAECREYSIR